MTCCGNTAKSAVSRNIRKRLATLIDVESPVENLTEHGGDPAKQRDRLASLLKEKGLISADEFASLHMLKYSIVGSGETVRKGLEELVTLTKADELMIVTSLYDHSARVRSYEIITS